jgi:hypothetical protein
MRNIPVFVLLFGLALPCQDHGARSSLDGDGGEESDSDIDLDGDSDADSDFKNAMDWTWEMTKDSYLDDDVRFWVLVPAIK